MKRFLLAIVLLALFGGLTYWLGLEAGRHSENRERRQSLAATAKPEAPAKPKKPKAESTPEETAEAESEEPEAVTFTPQNEAPLAEGELDMLQRLNGQITTLVDAVLPSVVNIRTTREISAQDLLGRGMRIPFEGPGAPEDEPAPLTAFGSGVIISHEGHIVTNAHVVKDATKIEVETADDRDFEAEVIGFDEPADIAVIRIKGEDFTPLKWGDSAALRVGEQVFAIGNPLGQTNSVSHGIVSALGRNPQISGYEDFIQTNAAINPGNSGGALVNIRGELIGINTAIASTTQGFQGIGFAIPSNHARFAMDSLITRGRVVRGWLGVGIRQLDPSLAPFFNMQAGDDAVLVTAVGPGTPAEEAGVRAEDVIVSFAGERVETPDELRMIVSQTPIGKTVDMDVMRTSGPKTLKVKIVEQPTEFAMMRSFSTEEDETPAEPEPPENRATSSSVLSSLVVADLDADARRQWKLPREAEGVVITKVDGGSAASHSGLREGDVIQSVRLAEGGVKRIPDVPTFLSVANGLGEEDSVVLMVNRGRGFPSPVLLEPTDKPAATSSVIP